MPEGYIESSGAEEEHEGTDLRSIDATRRLSTCTDVAEIIKHNDDLKYKLLKVQEEARHLGTAAALTKDKQDLLRVYERHYLAMSVSNTQLLSAVGSFPKIISKCTTPACIACYCRASQRKPWRTKEKHNERVLRKMKTRPGETDHTDFMKISGPGVITQIFSFLPSRKFHCTSFFVDGCSD